MSNSVSVTGNAFLASCNKAKTEATSLPLMDVLEDQQEVQILVEIPGVESSDIQLEIHQGQLVISANRNGNTFEGAKPLLRERSPVHYKRQLKLADSLDHDKIWAEHALGVLKVHVPKKAEVQKRKIEVRSA